MLLSHRIGLALTCCLTHIVPDVHMGYRQSTTEAQGAELDTVHADWQTDQICLFLSR